MTLAVVALLVGAVMFLVGAMVNLSIEGHPRDHWSERVGSIGFWLLAVGSIAAVILHGT